MTTQPEYVLVPREPTEAMIDAGCEQHQCAQGDTWYSAPELSYGDAVKIYRAMLAAAPQVHDNKVLWCLHILGPDDVHPAPSKAHAQRAADRFNNHFGGGIKGVACRAVVEPWPHSPESHAKSVEQFCEQWLTPASHAPAPASVSNGGEQTRPSSPGAGASIIVTLHDLVTCCRSWAPEARILGNIRADDAADAIEYAIAALQQPSANIEVRLFDSQWVNVVNHDNCYRDWSKEDAIAHAVRMTETLMRENVTKGFPAAPKPSAEQPSAQKAVAYCDPSDPINSTAFAWPGTDRDVARQKTPLYTAPTLRPVSNEDVEAAAETLWNTSSHKLLEKAEHPTDWKSQPETIKRDYRKQGRAALESVLARRMGGGE